MNAYLQIGTPHLYHLKKNVNNEPLIQMVFLGWGDDSPLKHHNDLMRYLGVILLSDIISSIGPTISVCDICIYLLIIILIQVLIIDCGYLIKMC